jgi:hypothetical protein
MTPPDPSPTSEIRPFRDVLASTIYVRDRSDGRVLDTADAILATPEMQAVAQLIAADVSANSMHAENPDRSDVAALFRARVLSEHGTWVGGALWRHREDAEAEASEMGERFRSETQVVDEFPAIPHPIALEIDRLQRRNSYLENENDELHDDVAGLLRRVGGAS